MRFHGLFIGIDRYASPRVNWLSCAKRDAVALHSLFADNLGTGKLLTDDQATRTKIKAEFDVLAKCAEEDVVVITYSGHGSATHELATFDADPADLRATSIPLDELTGWFSAIPARRLVFVLDCCFSGGAGARFLAVDSIPRSMESADELLTQLSGDGRLLITASSATQEALESSRLGHGLLTHYLLEALQGAEEVRQEGKVSVYKLLEFVSKRVSDDAALTGRAQTPSLRGRIDGALTWPIFKTGKTYRAMFPESARQPAKPEVASLATFGFPQQVLDSWAGSITKLNQLQLDSVNEFKVLDGEHLVVSAPTSSGKTMIGELAAVNGVLQRKRAVFLFPLKALVNDKYQEFQAKYAAFGIRVLRATGEISDEIPDLMRGRYDICLMTYEKCTALILGAPHILNQVGTIIVDEVQMIADESRGINLEYLLTLLRSRRKRGVEPQMILLSAVIGDTNGLERWLGARLLRRDERPVPLDEGIVKADGAFRYIDPKGKENTRPCVTRRYGKGSSQELIIPLVIHLAQQGEQIIVFRETKSETVAVARYLARELSLPPASTTLDALPAGDPSVSTAILRECLAKGVAFHNADLSRDERLAIEEEFRKRDATLRVIVATTTLAMGVNTPASSVIIAGLQHPGNPPTPYSVAEYKNMVGRAGRLGFVENGTSYLICLNGLEEDARWRDYVQAAPEDLISHFLADGTDLRSLVLRVIASSPGHRMEAEAIADFLEESFAAFRQSQQATTWKWDRSAIKSGIEDLKSHGLVETTEGLLTLTPLGRLAGEAGVQVETIVRLVEALRPTSDFNEATLIAATQLTVELDEIFFPLNKKSTQKEPQAWHGELTRQRVANFVLSAMSRFVIDRHAPTLRKKKAVACLLWMSAAPLEQIEQVLMQHTLGNSAAGPVRAVAARVVDILPVVADVAQILHPEIDLSQRVAALLTRLQLGIPPEMASLGVIVGSDLTRGDYLNLLSNKITTCETIDRLKDAELMKILGKDPRKLGGVRQKIKAAEAEEKNKAPVPKLEQLLPAPKR